ncbi:group II truncated hemoglobin [Thalassotalea algicola]|uniref:group II truncated hemoglobin n=1 Tax=Thalassotalea algicola TaxID=2716224 RepID=UPI001B7D6911|nr:group II truncated hemoglobin [Thalassotalea algicola]
MFGIKKLFSTTNKSETSSASTFSSNETSSSKTPYDLIGKEAGVKNLVNAFYDEMESNIHLQELLATHQLPLDNIRQKFFEYLSGWLGGPPLFEQKYGHPRLRQRHMHVKVTKKQSDLWMLCMNIALNKTVENKVLKQHLRQAFGQLANHMINH